MLIWKLKFRRSTQAFIYFYPRTLMKPTWMSRDSIGLYAIVTPLVLLGATYLFFIGRWTQVISFGEIVDNMGRADVLLRVGTGDLLVVERLEVEGCSVGDGVAARSNRVFNGNGLLGSIGAEGLRHRDQVVDQEVGTVRADVARQRRDGSDAARVAVGAACSGS